MPSHSISAVLPSLRVKLFYPQGPSSSLPSVLWKCGQDCGHWFLYSALTGYVYLQLVPFYCCVYSIVLAYLLENLTLVSYLGVIQ